MKIAVIGGKKSFYEFLESKTFSERTDYFHVGDMETANLHKFSDSVVLWDADMGLAFYVKNYRVEEK